MREGTFRGGDLLLKGCAVLTFLMQSIFANPLLTHKKTLCQINSYEGYHIMLRVYKEDDLFLQNGIKTSFKKGSYLSALIQKRSIFNVTIKTKVQGTSLSRNLKPHDIKFKMAHSPTHLFLKIISYS